MNPPSLLRVFRHYEELTIYEDAYKIRMRAGVPYSFQMHQFDDIKAKFEALLEEYDTQMQEYIKFKVQGN